MPPRSHLLPKLILPLVLGTMVVAHAQEVPTPDSTAAQGFRALCLAKAEQAAKRARMTIRGQDGWLFFGPELRHVGMGPFWGESAVKASQSLKPENADPIPAIVDFKAQLDKAGIELLMVPVPPKSVVYPDALDPKVPQENGRPVRVDANHQEFYAQLRRNGVQVLDLTEDFLAARDNAMPVYCKQDTHWSGRACVLAARRIQETIKDRPWLTGITKRPLEQNWKWLTIEGDLWLGLTGKQPPKEKLALRFIGTKAGTGTTPKPVPDDANSPVLLLGDSHDLVFHVGEDMLATGAGLADQLAFELGFPLDVIAVRGSGATPARTDLMRRARKSPGYLGKKKLVIWCFSAREFTETLGWQKVPVVP